MKGRLHIRHLLVALVVIPALYLCFIIYHAGAAWVALAMLIVTGVGTFIFLVNRPTRSVIFFQDFSDLVSL